MLLLQKAQKQLSKEKCFTIPTVQAKVA